MLLFVSFYKRYFQIKRDVLHLSIKHFREIRKIHRVLEKDLPVDCLIKLEVHCQSRKVYFGWISRISRKLLI